MPRLKMMFHRPEATLRVSGYLFLSKGIMKRAGNESATHCQLRFDEEKGLLGIKLTDASDSLVEAGCVVASGKSLAKIYITHAHGDHYFGLQTVADRAAPEPKAAF